MTQNCASCFIMRNSVRRSQTIQTYSQLSCICTCLPFHSQTYLGGCEWGDKGYLTVWWCHRVPRMVHNMAGYLLVAVSQLLLLVIFSLSKMHPAWLSCGYIILALHAHTKRSIASQLCAFLCRCSKLTILAFSHKI